MPQWALPVVVAVGALFLLFLGWRALVGPSGPVDNRPPLAVRPGMYDIRAEFTRGAARQQQQQQQQGQPASGMGAR